MKPQDDCSVFENDFLPLDGLAGETECRYRQNNRSSKAFHLPFEQTELFYAVVFYEMHCLGGTHYRRINGTLFSFEYVQKGRLYVRQDDRAYRLGPGDLFLMHPGTRVEYVVLPGDACVKLSCAVSGILLHSYLRESGLGTVDVMEHVDESRLLEHLSGFRALAARSDAEAVRENSRFTYRLLQFLRNPGLSPAVSGKIRPAVECMERHFDQSLTLKTLADLCGCSRPHLIRCFREAYGMPPHRMLLKLRMDHAARLLLNEPELSVKEIAARSGYARALNFSAEFRKYFGLSPLKYRRQSTGEHHLL